ncbi:T9SS type A sorting domain-containing protein [Flavobacterium rhizosphaerae]|uniref:T9SS type A sorting domain-containing protein n=1 Tax=Flavobacterium rhizosphaerae TaxID=3163298 RepID=A0ABW8YW90_9FLAO
MKKILLTGAVIAATFFNVTAQETSFEPSEGFTTGDIDGQNGWGISQAASAGTFLINDEQASEGTYSLKLVPENGTAHATLGAFSPTFNESGEVITHSFDFYSSSFAEEDSNFYFSAQSPTQGFVSSRVVFAADGSLVVLDYTDPEDEESLDYVVVENVSFNPETWYHVEVVQNNVYGTIEYFVDDNSVYTGSIFGATIVEQFVISHDNFAGEAYFDNIQISTAVASVKNNTLASVSVYPNPATDVINISNGGAINNISVTDLNGRVVRTAAFEGVSDASVNVSDLAKGIYMVTVSSDKGSTTQKIVKN